MAFRAHPTLLLSSALVLLVSACENREGEDVGPNPMMDAGVVDTGEPPPDTGAPDTGENPDAGDMGAPDLGDMGPPDMGDDPQSIVFIHTNDEQSHYLGTSPNIDDYPVLSQNAGIKGGVFRRAAVIEQIRDEASRPPISSPTVLVGAGDVSMGTLFHLGNLFVSPDYNVQTALNYDVLTLGNHEFDFGTQNLAQMLSLGNLDIVTQQFSPLEIPVVASNIRFSRTSPSDDLLASLYASDGSQPLRRLHVEDFSGVTVGFVGVMGLEASLVAPFKNPVNFSLAVDPMMGCTDDTACPGSICVPPADDPTATSGNCALDPSGNNFDVNFPALVADISSAVAELRAQGVDIVVAVSHSGVNEPELNMLEAMGMGPENAVRSEEIILARGVDEALAAQNIPGIDVIIGGHSHTALQAPLSIFNENSGINTYIVQAGHNNEFVGKLRITRENSSAPWVLDTDFSGLVTVDDSLQNQQPGLITSMVLDGLIAQLIDGLEQQPIAMSGDGLIFPGEQCDGMQIPNGGDCVGVIPGATGGTLACFANSQLDTSGCTFPAFGKGGCGDDFTDPGLFEQCDGTDLPQNCQDLGYDSGPISCHNNCTYDVSSCVPHFSTLLEAALNFALRPGIDPELRYVLGQNQRGDHFFYQLGQASFDVGETVPGNESNLANLVADANREMSNTLIPDNAETPIEIAIVANGIIRDGLYSGQMGILSAADLFRVVPLGISPIENTPGFPLTDFWLRPAEVKAGLELAVSQGLTNDSFWLGFSGARVEYDLSLPEFDPANPTTTGRITKIHLHQTQSGSQPAEDITAFLENEPIFDASLGMGAFPDPTRLIHISANFFITSFIETLGICPRLATGDQHPACRACMNDLQCGTDVTCSPEGRCTGGLPAALQLRSVVPFGGGFVQELKEFLALTTYVRRLPNGGQLPMNYSEDAPRRMCCVGAECPADDSRTCPPQAPPPLGN